MLYRRQIIFVFVFCWLLSFVSSTHIHVLFYDIGIYLFYTCVLFHNNLKTILTISCVLLLFLFTILFFPSVRHGLNNCVDIVNSRERFFIDTRCTCSVQDRFGHLGSPNSEKDLESALLPEIGTDASVARKSSPTSRMLAVQSSNYITSQTSSVACRRRS